MRKIVVNKNKKAVVNTPPEITEWYRDMGKKSHRMQKKRDPVAYKRMQGDKARLGGLARARKLKEKKPA